jgi:hypothetical protein
MVDLLDNFLNILKLFLVVASGFTKSWICALKANMQGVRRKRLMADQLQPISLEMGRKG